MQKLKFFPALLVAYETVTYLSNDAYLPALPTIIVDFSTTTQLAQLSLTLWLLGGCLIQPLLGPICDRFGRRPVLLIGGIFFILSTLLCGITQQISIFLIARFIQGAAVPTLAIAGYAAIHELLDHDNAIRTLAWMSSVTVFAPSLGPLLGAVLLYLLNWRDIFIALGGLAILFLSLLALKMPETLSPLSIQPLLIKRVGQTYWAILKNMDFMLKVSLLCCILCAMITWICVSPLLLIQHFHYSLIGYGMVQMYVFGSFIIGTYFVHCLLTRIITNKLLLVGGLLIGSAGLIIILSVIINSLAGFILAMMLTGAGTGIWFPIFNRFAVESSKEPMAMRMTVISTLVSVCAVLSSIIIEIIPINLLSIGMIILFCNLLAILLFSLEYKCISNISIES